MSRLPTYENCQPAEGEEPDPKEIFQWAMVALPFSGSTPLIVQPEVRPEWSKLFWDLGFRHHPELQVKKVLPPHRGQQHALNASVAVVDKDDPDNSAVVLPNITDGYTPHEEEVLKEIAYQKWFRKDQPEPPGASVVDDDDSTAKFDPSEHTAREVNVYLQFGNHTHAEKMRVMAVEMQRKGGPRPGVLRANPGI